MPPGLTTGELVGSLRPVALPAATGPFTVAPTRHPGRQVDAIEHSHGLVVGQVIEVPACDRDRAVTEQLGDRHDVDSSGGQPVGDVPQFVRVHLSGFHARTIRRSLKVVGIWGSA